MRINILSLFVISLYSSSQIEGRTWVGKRSGQLLGKGEVGVVRETVK